MSTNGYVRLAVWCMRPLNIRNSICSKKWIVIILFLLLISSIFIFCSPSFFWPARSDDEKKIFKFIASRSCSVYTQHNVRGSILFVAHVLRWLILILMLLWKCSIFRSVTTGLAQLQTLNTIIMTCGYFNGEFDISGWTFYSGINYTENKKRKCRSCPRLSKNRTSSLCVL